MMVRVQELCRKLKPVLGTKIDRLWLAYLAQSDADGKSDVWQTLELLAAKHLGQDYQPDRSPFPPPKRDFAESGDIELGQLTYGARRNVPPSCSRVRDSRSISWSPVEVGRARPT